MTKPFILEPDAAQGEEGARSFLGAALLQEQDGVKRVIAYGSRCLTEEESRSYHSKTTELELYSAVYWMKYWRHYLHGHDFTVVTDHKPLLPILNDGLASRATKEQTRITRLAMKLEEFRPGLKAKWRAGKEHTLADAMTRGPIGSVDNPAAVAAPARSGEEPRRTLPIDMATASSADQRDKVREAQLADPVLGDIMVFLESDSLPDDGGRAKRTAALAAHMVVEDGVLYNNWWPPGGQPSRLETRCQLAVPAGRDARRDTTRVP